MEIWKDILGYEGQYQVSNEGRVRSLPRRTLDGRGSYVLKGRELRLQIGRSGYYKVTLIRRANTKSGQPSVHRLVAQAFISNPDRKEFVNHKNNIKTDNRIENLEWTNQRENLMHGALTKGTKASRYPGVSRNQGKWMASLCENGKVKNLGRFESEEMAFEVYRNTLAARNLTNKYVQP